VCRRDEDTILLGKCEKKRPFGRYEHRRKDNIKIDNKEILKLRIHKIITKLTPHVWMGNMGTKKEGHGKNKRSTNENPQTTCGCLQEGTIYIMK
jgi:hypothetical protein